MIIIERKLLAVLTQVANAISPYMATLTINYQTGDCAISTAVIPNAQLLAAKARLEDMGFTVAADAVSHVATIHSDAIIAIANNLPLANLQNVRSEMVNNLGYGVVLDTTAKTVTLTWDRGLGLGV